jgi:uncharacterized protein YigE (DUF2233 family)
MAWRRLPVGRIAALAALLVAALVLIRGVPRPRWKTLRPGLEFAMISGDPWCRRGSSQIALLRIDPAHARLRVHYFGVSPAGRPLDAVEWQRSTGAEAVFNAGQFTPDWTYLGLLVSGGNVISKRKHATFKAALVAGPQDGGSAARVLDLEHDSLDAARPQWSEVAQSFMLFDRDGRLRVRNSDKVANRTAVGEDRSGRLIVFVTEGAYTIDDFARLVQKSPFQITHAMAMDGGSEAQLCVVAGGFRYTCMGGRTRGATSHDAADVDTPLPAVISVAAR